MTLTFYFIVVIFDYTDDYYFILYVFYILSVDS